MSTAFERDYKEQSLRSLYSKMKKTAKARFNCATRLQRHQTFSLWSLSLFSTGLIGMTLLSALNIHTNIDVAHFNLLQIMLALLVLILSLLLSANSYSDRAEKMHRCALEVNELCHRILPDCKDDTDKPEIYRNALAEYSSALEAFENHAPIDFDLVRIELSVDYPLTFRQKMWIRIRYFFSFGLYVALVILLLASFVWVLH